MADSPEVTLIFREEELIRAKDLNSFLYFFRIVYGIAVTTLDFESISSVEELDHNSTSMIEHVRNVMASTTLDYLEDYYWAPDLEDRELFIETILHESPLRMSFRAMLYPLIIAIVMAGGTADLAHMTFEVNGLADGVHQITQTTP